MKNRFLKTVGMTLLLVSSLQADIPYTNALFGIEGGYSLLDHKFSSDSSNVSRGETDFINIGLKAGAETQSLRTFVSINYCNDPSSLYDYLFSYGLEVQYKFLSTQYFNLYAGVNGGYSQTKISIQDESFFRTINSPYIGGSLGGNIYLGDSFELELGARLKAINEENIKYETSYKIDNLITGYASIIYKFKMD